MFGRFLSIGVALAAAMSIGTAASAQRITIGSNPQGTLYYVVGGGIAAVLQDSLQRPATVQPFSGSSVYVPLIANDEVTLGLNSSIDVGAWYRGEYGNEPFTQMRVLARLWPLRQAFMVRADSGMTQVSDLVGRRVVTDVSAQAATGRVNVGMLIAGGLTPEQVEGVTISGMPAGVEGLTENRIDATGIAVGIPLTQQAHASIPGGIRYLSISGDSATNEVIGDFFTGVYLDTINPSPRLPEVTEPVTIAAYDVFLTASANLSDADVQAILGALWDAMPQLVADYPAMAGAAREVMAMPTNTVPFHPAAVQFYQERGIWTDANTAREATVN